MSWEAAILASLFLFAATMNAAMVGKPRKPLDGGAAAFAVLSYALCIWLVLRLDGAA